MKALPFLVPVLLAAASCAPKAVMVEEEVAPAPPVAAQEKKEAPPEPSELPDFAPSDGLLDPAGLTSMPSERDMQATVDPPDASRSTVIANPPDKAKPTSE